MAYMYEIGTQVNYSGSICTILSIDGHASASNPASNYPVTVQFENGTIQSLIQSNQLRSLS
jgi:hypothetical protein